MIGFAFYGHDNGTYFFKNRVDVRRCGECGHLLHKWSETVSGIRLANESFDVSCSYDGVHVVSQRFKVVYDSCGFSGLEFRLLYDTFYFVLPTEQVRFDFARRKTRFMKQCDACQFYESVTGATPVFLKRGETISPRAFARTDIEFGSGDEKAPLYLCGVDVGQTLREADLAGLGLLEIQ